MVCQNMNGEICDARTTEGAVVQIMACKVTWKKRLIEVKDKETDETRTESIQPESSIVSLAEIKQKDQLKLLDFYESCYFSTK